MRRNGRWLGICLGAVAALAVAGVARADNLSKAVDSLAKELRLALQYPEGAMV